MPDESFISLLRSGIAFLDHIFALLMRILWILRPGCNQANSQPPDKNSPILCFFLKKQSISFWHAFIACGYKEKCTIREKKVFFEHKRNFHTCSSLRRCDFSVSWSVCCNRTVCDWFDSYASATSLREASSIEVKFSISAVRREFSCCDAFAC